MDYSIKVRYQGRQYDVKAKDIGTKDSRIEFKCLGQKRVVYEEIPELPDKQWILAILNTLAANKIHEIVKREQIYKESLKIAQKYGVTEKPYEMPD